MKKNPIVIGLSSSKELAKKSAKLANIDYLYGNASSFADGEININIEKTVRNKQVFVVQSTCKPVNDNLMELLLTIDALKRASAGEINVVIPYFGYSRQDKTFSREPITARLVANMIEAAGADRLITFDLHSGQSKGFFTIPVDNLPALNILAGEIKKKNISKLTVVTPDHGGTKRAREIANILESPLAVIDKRRETVNKAEAQFVLGNVKNRNVLIVDDMVDTAGTIVSGIKILKEEGAKDIYVASTHPILSSVGKGKNIPLEKMKAAGVKKFFTTDSIKKNFKDDIMKVHSLSKILSEILNVNVKSESVTDLFYK